VHNGNDSSLQSVCSSSLLAQVNRMAENRTYSNAKARVLLLFEPQYDLEDAIRQTVRYNLSHGHLTRHSISPVALVGVSVLLLSSLFFIVYSIL